MCKCVLGEVGWWGAQVVQQSLLERVNAMEQSNEALQAQNKLLVASGAHASWHHAGGSLGDDVSG